jgi:hypothetical protein
VRSAFVWAIKLAGSVLGHVLECLPERFDPTRSPRLKIRSGVMPMRRQVWRHGHGITALRITGSLYCCRVKGDLAQCVGAFGQLGLLLDHPICWMYGREASGRKRSMLPVLRCNGGKGVLRVGLEAAGGPGRSAFCVLPLLALGQKLRYGLVSAADGRAEIYAGLWSAITRHSPYHSAPLPSTRVRRSARHRRQRVALVIWQSNCCAP